MLAEGLSDALGLAESEVEAEGESEAEGETAKLCMHISQLSVFCPSVTFLNS